MSDTDSSTTTPNIIFVQLESFFDVNAINDITLAENPIPYFTKLYNENISGYLTVPTIGAGTINTEFEILTGMSMEYFGAGEYPYKTALKSSTCESVCYNLKKLGYTTSAIHNHQGSFYGRNTTYTHLGFDRFTSIEYMNGVEYTPKDWAKDRILTSQIKEILDSTKQHDFVFAVSVQGHGVYPGDIEEDDFETVIPGNPEDPAYESKIEYYISVLKMLF